MKTRRPNLGPLQQEVLNLLKVNGSWCGDWTFRTRGFTQNTLESLVSRNLVLKVRKQDGRTYYFPAEGI